MICALMSMRGIRDGVCAFLIGSVPSSVLMLCFGCSTLVSQ